jgi:hypothetical protein
MIIKSLPYSKPEFKLTTGTEKIGDTLFVNGVPHKICGKCAIPVGSEAYERKLVSRGATKSKGKIVRDGKVTYESKEYKISILLRWAKLGEEIIWKDGFPTLKENWIPKLISRPACFDCWNEQQKRGGWFKVDECEGI